MNRADHLCPEPLKRHRHSYDGANPEDVMAARLERALLDAEIVVILQRANPATVQTALLLAGARDGDLAFYLRLVIQGMLADPAVPPADRIAYLTKVCDAFGFAIARDPAARKTFGMRSRPVTPSSKIFASGRARQTRRPAACCRRRPGPFRTRRSKRSPSR